MRGAEVEEILLPSSPLGGLGHTYGQGDAARSRRATPLVWLSDGLIEATNAADEPFGYDSVIAGPGRARPARARSTIRNRLLAAVERHTAGHAAGG